MFETALPRVSSDAAKTAAQSGDNDSVARTAAIGRLIAEGMKEVTTLDASGNSEGEKRLRWRFVAGACGAAQWRTGLDVGHPLDCELGPPGREMSRTLSRSS